MSYQFYPNGIPVISVPTQQAPLSLQAGAVAYYTFTPLYGQASIIQVITDDRSNTLQLYTGYVCVGAVKTCFFFSTRSSTFLPAYLF